MSNANTPSTPNSGTLSPSSDNSNTQGRTSSMPDEPRHTARLRKLHDHVPPRRDSIIFTGANSSKMNHRLRRLAPPKGRPVVNRPKHTKSPGYYGGDLRKFEKRTKRYVDGKNSSRKNGGPPVFSGSSGTAYVARMMRLEDRH